jgi:hypothetical protein
LTGVSEKIAVGFVKAEVWNHTIGLLDMVDYLAALLLFGTPLFHIIGCKYYHER